MTTIRDYVTGNYPGHSAAFISEVFSQLEGQPSELAKREFLKAWMVHNQANSSKITTLRNILECLLLDTVVFELEAGLPGGTSSFASRPDQAPSSLYKIMRNIGYFLRGSPTLIRHQLKREKVFIQQIEQLHKAEAMLLLAMKDKDKTYVPSLTYEFISGFLPGWFPPKPMASGVQSEAKKETGLIDSSVPLKVKKKPGRPPKPKVLAVG